jgi:TRAP-type mannitol/chloroaromatic compound transport system permease small subunit
MGTLLRIAGWIDALNGRVGRAAGWLVLAVVLVGAWNAVARYTGRFTGLALSGNGLIELQWYLFSAVFLLGAAYTLKHNEHVRVDVLFQRVSPRGQAWIEVAGIVVFLLPFTALVVWSSWGPAANAWAINELSPDPGGLPRWPVKALIPLGFILLGLQALAELIKRVAFLVNHPSAPPPPAGGRG